VNAVQKLLMNQLPHGAPPSNAVLMRGRSVTVKPPTNLRLRATTTNINSDSVSPVKPVLPKQVLEKLMGINDMKSWNSILQEQDSLVHMGGAIGDVHITKNMGPASSCEEIVKAMVAMILNSNAAAITVKATQHTVFGAAKTLLDHISSALCGLRDSLPDNFSPESEELLIAALQRSSTFDCHTQTSTNEHMLADPEPFRVFLELLKNLHAVSASFRSIGGNRRKKKGEHEKNFVLVLKKSESSSFHCSSSSI
jgi:hypothetical protein